MTLKILRLQVPRKFVEKIGLTDMFIELEQLEILNAYQYDQNNFFSLQRIRFRPNRVAFVDKILRENLKAEYYEMLHQHGDEILCIMKQRCIAGFFPNFGMGPWAILFPISVEEKNIHVNLLSEEQYLSHIYEMIPKYVDSYQVVGISNVNNAQEIGQTGLFQMPFPSFTAKQRDIATYAAQHGYFESPKQITAKAIADKFQVTESAVNMHLKNAENLAMKFFFGEVA